MKNDNETLEERILLLDSKCKHPSGFSLSKTLLEPKGTGWCVGMGQAGMPKTFFYAKSLDEAISMAEKAFED